MSVMPLDDDLDALYQLPLNEFTAARNELAKRAGSGAAEVRKLAKPPVAAWVVNQLYWKDRRTYDALIDAAEALRAAHASVLKGKSADLRFAAKEHEEALERALKRTLTLLADGGHPVTEATRNAVSQTLRALPADDAPGRLTRALAPGGFEMLSGIAVRGPGTRGRAGKAAPKPAAGPSGRAPSTEDRRQAQAREEAAAAARALREAEQAVRRAEFEAARASRTAAKADAARTEARAALEDARRRLEHAEAEAEAADRKKQSADRSLATATHQVDAARRRADAAARAVKSRTP